MGGGQCCAEFCELVAVAALELGDLRHQGAQRAAAGVGLRGRRRLDGTLGLLLATELADAGRELVVAVEEVDRAAGLAASPSERVSGGRRSVFEGMHAQ